jgi:hypothetical protein
MFTHKFDTTRSETSQEAMVAALNDIVDEAARYDFDAVLSAADGTKGELTATLKFADGEEIEVDLADENLLTDDDDDYDVDLYYVVAERLEEKIDQYERRRRLAIEKVPDLIVDLLFDGHCNGVDSTHEQVLDAFCELVSPLADGPEFWSAFDEKFQRELVDMALEELHEKVDRIQQRWQAAGIEYDPRDSYIVEPEEPWTK